ncbi:hypothetical protein P9G84_32055 [Brevibacillus centrosporus]|uniref:hypothetical protein n=1 Tax=Brevibacillus centrosporus TaxID=54910 RepID=UPI000F0A349A|nr:hypothetical protein [Brevibacillus centrosporus]MEC2133485.1 hypothetical protein [Brevibacillus centrosporus]RNB64202.1 hypothetical protein EDM55_27925 [Brevibacillus centrosporus]GED34995.1 hypothetical protein BCE02nite_61360 [Brevibacillus centrosporus]
MARKRRYYREERRRPVYWEEDEDDFEEEDESFEITDKFVKNTSWTLLAVLGFGIVLSLAQTFYTPSGTMQTGDGFRVVSVSKGKLHVEDMRTGRSVSFDDQKLVKAALNGFIKRGDVIYP